ncbi:deoxyribose-phosphate aldolase [Bellilinea caldifistulae]|uniref:Deoxyribose-phosphate aldolase n=1 Tax=Bellilinea caldifistulae TaxID=360411 RepID=A0A0P6XWD8_9CHLR|nr:deoxyribose-phosphate aldolase [Bellilinea caldifistulae]KPL73639.1 deoxyribose-phosphate aldolase [Bellilinea caldifistulae]GAP10277.1 deoxyribose-phosphate aldolase [Bellilinea caldifistulae]
MTAINVKTITYEQLAKVIDHSLLRPELTSQEVIEGCQLAARYHVATVCVKPCHVRLAAEQLKDSDVLVSTVVGFPHGSSVTEIKVAEAQRAMDDGAVELDMVLNIGELRSGNDEYVYQDIKAVCDAAHARGVKVKVILENAYLTDEEKVRACQLAEKAGADWVKTSTGFAPGGAILDDLRLMRRSVSEKVQIKAAGGVRTLDALLAVIEAGVTRCGATATAKILDDFKARQAGEQTSTGEVKIGGEY